MAGAGVGSGGWVCWRGDPLPLSFPFPTANQPQILTLPTLTPWLPVPQPPPIPTSFPCISLDLTHPFKSILHSEVSLSKTQV